MTPQERIDLDDIALMFHNKGEYAGFQCSIYF